MLADIEQAINDYSPASSNDLALDETLNRPIRDFVRRGGKRLRPRLFLSIIEGFGSNPADYLDLALLIELIHNSTLIIDDIEDDSTLRRGRPTLHKSFGLDVAVNTGVALHTLPLQFITDNRHLTDSQRLKLFQIYVTEINRLYFGQATDIYWHNHQSTNISVDQYFQMCRLKTGSLMSLSTHFACVITNQSKKVTDALVNFATNAGVAFQIKDDVLDLTAQPKKFGKAYGNDISEGKISLPVIIALQQLPESQQTVLVNILQQHTQNKQLIQQAHTIISTTDAISTSLARAQQLLTDSWHDVTQIIPAYSKFSLLQELITSFTRREH